jgi:chromosome segregation ATPase
MEIAFLAVMEETLKKALKTGIETLISVTEEVRHGLTVLDKDIQDLSRRVKDSNAAEKANEKLDELVEKSVAAIKEYEQRATEISRKVQQHLAEVDPLARQSVEELSEKLNALAKSLGGRDPSPPQKA